MDRVSEPPFPIWQGFRHTWTYNHRLNRLGDWARSHQREGDTVSVEIGHSAASGTGRDEASFESFRAVTRADGVYFKEFSRTVEIRSEEEESQSFAREVRFGAEDGIPEDCDVFVACLSGFDLCSEKDADKLISFHLATTQPFRDTETGEVVFSVFGALNVDCDSAECDLYENTGTMIAAIAIGGLAGFQLGGPLWAAAGGVLGGLLSRLDITTDYTLVLRGVLISGKADDLATTRCDFTNELTWDKETPITRSSEGIQRVELQGDNDSRWQASLPVITQISLEVTRERGIFRPDTAMHFLQWDMAVRPVEATGTNCTADLDLFFRNWRARESNYLDEYIDLGLLSEIDFVDECAEDIASHRDAGTAVLTMGLALLQFAKAGAIEQGVWEDSLIWQGRNESAKSDDAVKTDVAEHEISPPEEAEASLPMSDPNPVLIAFEHCN